MCHRSQARTAPHPGPNAAEAKTIRGCCVLLYVLTGSALVTGVLGQWIDMSGALEGLDGLIVFAVVEAEKAIRAWRTRLAPHAGIEGSVPDAAS